MKIYYAHHSWKYDTPIEQYEMTCIYRQFEGDHPVIVNPKDEILQEKPESEIMQDCYAAINGCDALVFSTYSGMIGHGVFNEIIYAFNTGKKVYHLHGSICWELDDFEFFMNEVLRDFIFNGDNRTYAILNSPF